MLNPILTNLQKMIQISMIHPLILAVSYLHTDFQTTALRQMIWHNTRNHKKTCK